MKDEKYYKSHIASVLDFPKKGINFRDITTTLENAEVFHNCIDDIAELVKDFVFNKIVCADARGFIFGSALAYKLNKALVVARKPNKLPRPGHSHSYTLEYGENTMLISQDSIKKGDRCLIVDDLLATGGSALAMVELVKKSEGTPVAGVFYIELPDLNGREVIKKGTDIPVLSLVKFEGE